MVSILLGEGSVCKNSPMKQDTFKMDASMCPDLKSKDDRVLEVSSPGCGIRGARQAWGKGRPQIRFNGNVRLLDDMGCQAGVESAKLTTAMKHYKITTTESPPLSPLSDPSTAPPSPPPQKQIPSSRQPDVTGSEAPRTSSRGQTLVGIHPRKRSRQTRPDPQEQSQVKPPMRHLTFSPMTPPTTTLPKNQISNCQYTL